MIQLQDVLLAPQVAGGCGHAGVTDRLAWQSPAPPTQTGGPTCLSLGRLTWGSGGCHGHPEGAWQGCRDRGEVNTVLSVPQVLPRKVQVGVGFQREDEVRDGHARAPGPAPTSSVRAIGAGPALSLTLVHTHHSHHAGETARAIDPRVWLPATSCGLRPCGGPAVEPVPRPTGSRSGERGRAAWGPRARSRLRAHRATARQTAREPGEGRQGVHSVCTRSHAFTRSFGRTPGGEAWAHRGAPAARCPGCRKVCGTGQAWSRGPEASESPGLRQSLGYPLRFGHKPRGLDRPNPLPVPGQSRALLPSVRHGVSSSQAGEDGGPGRAAGGPCPQAQPQGFSEGSRQPRPYTHGN